ncbi:hypothetical protein ACFWBX_06375 [Streptomyces sp. NPDC059991]|uniref:hypothetical protein n=1 Tax=Streptomyces sp. NPDC059991 TaxID=3347028 RepID=UPI0036A4DB4C
MASRLIREKAVCHLTQNSRLLVFPHVDYSYEEVGLQVPVGNLDPSETPESPSRSHRGNRPDGL